MEEETCALNQGSQDSISTFRQVAKKVTKNYCHFCMASDTTTYNRFWRSKQWGESSPLGKSELAQKHAERSLEKFHSTMDKDDMVTFAFHKIRWVLPLYWEKKITP